MLRYYTSAAAAAHSHARPASATALLPRRLWRQAVDATIARLNPLCSSLQQLERLVRMCPLLAHLGIHKFDTRWACSAPGPARPCRALHVVQLVHLPTLYCLCPACAGDTCW